MAIVLGCSSAAPVVTHPSSAGLVELVSDGDPRTFLVVVAHPDDENMVGPALSRLARFGHTVRVLIATDGKYSTLNARMAPEVLGSLRRKESECALQTLGLPPPTFLAIDRLDTLNGVRSYLEGRKRLLAALRAALTTMRPDAILTFGPDGEYGHPEHIVVGSAMTEVLLSDGLVDTYPLYYLLWTPGQVTDGDGHGYVDVRYVTHKLGHTDDDESRSFAAARCYASQTTAAEVDELVRQVSEDTANTYFFRQFHAPVTGARQ